MTMTNALGRHARCALRQQCRAYLTRRGLASAASGSFTYETGETTGVKFASRDLPGPTTHVAVVARAGTRYQPMPGFTDGLEQFAFKVRSIFNTIRESYFGWNLILWTIRILQDARHCALHERQSYWGASFKLTIHVRIS